MATNGTMVAESDANLIARSLTQPECFEVVFDRHFTPVYRYLRRRVGEDIAQELAAETFTQAFRGRRRFRGTAALPWLYGIAANLLKDNHRREVRRLQAYARAAQRDHEHSSIGDADARMDAAAMRSDLARALAGLSPALREVLLLHAWAELSNDEIAEALDLSPSAVRARLHRARCRVAAQLGAETEEPLVLEGGVVRESR